MLLPTVADFLLRQAMANSPRQRSAVSRLELMKLRSRLDLAQQLSTNVIEAKAKLEDAKKRQEEIKIIQEEATRALNGANARVQVLSRDVDKITRNESFMTEVIFYYRVKQHSFSV